MAQHLHNISLPNDGLGDPLRTAFDFQNQMNTELYTTKVDKILGKELSANDFTNTLKNKLDGIENGAQVNVLPDFSQNDPNQPDYILNRPSGIISTRLDYGKIVKTGKGFTVNEFGEFTQNSGPFELDEAGDIFRGITNDGYQVPYMRYIGVGDPTNWDNHIYDASFSAWLPGEPKYVEPE